MDVGLVILNSPCVEDDRYPQHPVIDFLKRFATCFSYKPACAGASHWEIKVGVKGLSLA